MRQFLHLFNDRIYWLVAALVLLICYFELRFRWAAGEMPVRHSDKIPSVIHEEQKKRMTVDEVHKLVNSDPYRRYMQKKYEGKVIDIDNEEEWDQDFVKDLEDNEETIYDS